jgi:hypothetical protein
VSTDDVAGDFATSVEACVAAQASVSLARRPDIDVIKRFVVVAEAPDK